MNAIKILLRNVFIILSMILSLAGQSFVQVSLADSYCGYCSKLPSEQRTLCLMTCNGAEFSVSFDLKHQLTLDGAITGHLGTDVQTQLDKWSAKADQFQNSINSLTDALNVRGAEVSQRVTDVNHTGKDLVKVGQDGLGLGNKINDTAKDAIGTAKDMMGIGKDAMALGKEGIDTVKGFQPLLADLNKQISGIQSIMTPENMFQIALASGAGFALGTEAVNLGLSLLTGGIKQAYEWIRELITRENEKAALREHLVLANKDYRNLRKMRDQVLDQAKMSLVQLKINMSMPSDYTESLQSGTEKGFIELERQLLLAKAEKKKAVNSEEDFYYWSTQVKKLSTAKEMAPTLNQIVANMAASLSVRYTQACSQLKHTAHELYRMEHNLQMLRLAIIEGHFVSLEDADLQVLEAIKRSGRGVDFRSDAKESLAKTASLAIRFGYNSFDAWGAYNSSLLTQTELAKIMRTEKLNLRPDLAVYARSRQSTDDGTREAVDDQICIFDANRCQTLKYSDGRPVRDTRMEGIVLESETNDLCDAYLNLVHVGRGVKEIYMEENELEVYFPYYLTLHPDAFCVDKVEAQRIEADALFRASLANESNLMRKIELLKNQAQSRRLTEKLATLEEQLEEVRQTQDNAQATLELNDSLEWQRKYEIAKQDYRENSAEQTHKIFVVNSAAGVLESRAKSVNRLIQGESRTQTFLTTRLDRANQLILLFSTDSTESNELKKLREQVVTLENKLQSSRNALQILYKKSDEIRNDQRRLVAWRNEN